MERGRGHIEASESPLAACLREVREETGYRLASARYAGVLTWRGFEVHDGGLYIFTAQAPAHKPGPCAEGVLRWRALPWVLSSPEVVPNIAYFAPAVLAGAPPRRHHFDYRDGEIVRYLVQELPAGL